MKKYANFIVVGIVILIAVVVACAISFSGIKNGDYDYVAIEINPKFELISKNNKVVTVNARNKEAKQVLCGLDLEGMQLEEAIEKILDTTTRMGYLSIDATKENCDNAIKMTVVAGITYNKEVHIYETIQKYLKDHEILGVIVENEKDMQMVKRAKKEEVANVDKLYLMDRIMEQDSTKEAKDLKKKTNEQLIDLLFDIHQKKEVVYTDEEIKEKEELMDENASTFEEHVQKIDEQSKRKFNETYTKYRKENLTHWELNYPQN